MKPKWLADLRVSIPQKDFATVSDDYLRGFQAGVEAAIDAVAADAIHGLPTITKEEGLAMRTGLPTPDSP